MLRNKGIAFKLIFYILVSALIIFILIFGYNYIVVRQVISRKIEESAKNLAQATTSRIDIVLRSVEKAPENLACFIENSSYSKEELINSLRSVVENNPEIYGGTIAFEPYAFNSESIYFAPYFYKSNGEIKFTYLGSETYRYFYWDWYQIPRELERPMWSEPYYDVGGGNIIMATYSVPFYKTVDGERRLTGIVTADISLLWLQKMVSSIKISQTGYGFLISKNGTVVTHPTEKLIMNETIFSVAEARGDAKLREIGREMIKGMSGFVPFNSIVTGKKCWMVYGPVFSSGWSLGVLFPQDELLADITRLNRMVFSLVIAGILFLSFIIASIASNITRPLRTLAKKSEEIGSGNLDVEIPSVKSRDEVGQLTESFVYMKQSLKQYIKELTETTAAKERIESELKIAHDIQMSIVPKIFPPFPERSEFDIYATLEPAREVGGDFYDFFFIDDKHLCFVIGDVSGKGVPASLFMAVTKTLIKTIASKNMSPNEILKRANVELCHDNDSCMFVTIFLGILNTKTGEVLYTNGGHNPPLIVHKGKGGDFLEMEQGTAIGAFEDIIFKTERLVLQSGDYIFMYTDGVTEAVNKTEELFSEERLKRDINVLLEKSVKELVLNIVEKIKDFSQGVPQADDITMMVIKYKRKFKS
ncbi:SpoIIE family protein phosphatase [candidate division WOR-3 bacterium]|nr:SpoIIE family protein phosphatase [candidate division WOR-3 bacterium]